MSDLHVRPVESPAEMEAYKVCYEEVWRSGEPFAEGDFDPGDDSLRYLGEVSGEVACIYKVHRYEITRGGISLPCAGVASVGVRPQFRASGVGSQLMRWSLEDLQRQGFSIAALYPFRGTYYRKFGYEFAGLRWRIQCPMDRFPHLDAELHARRIMPDEVVKLDACYRQFISGVNGANIRTPKQWTQRMGKKPPLVYAVGDPIEAYAWLSTDGPWWEELPVGELAWSTDRGYSSLMAFLRGVGINRSALVWSEPTHGPFLSRYLDQGAEISLHRPAMYRILDLQKVLQSVKSPVEDEIILEVQDPDLPSNHGRWKWTTGPEGSIVETTDQASDLIASIGAFTQAFLGEPSLERLVACGAIQTDDLDRISYLFPPTPVFCTEFF